MFFLFIFDQLLSKFFNFILASEIISNNNLKKKKKNIIHREKKYIYIWYINLHTNNYHKFIANNFLMIDRRKKA